MGTKILFFFVLILVLFISSYVFLAFSIANYISATTPDKADAVIVLGARSYVDGKDNPCLVSRINTGVTLRKNEQVKMIIMSGGDDKEDKVNEAETMKKIALEKGASESTILLEKESTSTYENLLFSKEVMQKNNLKTAIIVTEPFHIARARLVAKSLGIDALYVASENSSCWEKGKYLSKYFLKEPLGIMYYLLQKRISLSALVQ